MHIPKHARTAANRLLELPIRKHIIEAVSAEPGITAASLREALGLRWGNFDHHLAKLESGGWIQLVRERKRSFIFPAGLDAWHLAALATLRRRTHALRIMGLISTRPGIRQEKAIKALGISRKVLRESAADLARAGLLMSHGGPGVRVYLPTPRGASLLARFASPQQESPLHPVRGERASVAA